MRFLIGFGLIIVGGVLGALTGFPLFLILLFIGVFLFASLTSSAMFYDYALADTDKVLVRKRHYIVFLPFHIIALILTLGKSSLLIVCKEEYFLATAGPEGITEQTPITRQNYLTLRDQQRQIYSNRVLSKEFMTAHYSPEQIGLQRKKRRLTLAGVFAALMLTMVTVPGGIVLTLIYEAVFVPMILLWLPEYKDAKILQQAYARSMAQR